MQRPSKSLSVSICSVILACAASAVLGDSAQPMELARSKARFLPYVNTVSVPGRAGGYIQRIGPQIGTIVVEAEDFDAMGSYPHLEWAASPVGYPPKYPNGDFVGDACGAVDLNCSGMWATVKAGPFTSEIHKDITVRLPGRYNLWVRYQAVQGRTQPFEVKVEHDFKATLNEQNRYEYHGRTLACRTFGTSEPFGSGLAAVVAWEHLQVDLPAGQVRISILKPADESPQAADRSIDLILLTMDLDYQPVGPIQLPDYQTVQRRIRQLSLPSDQRFALWTDSCWSNFSNKTWPRREQLGHQAAINMTQNEREQALFLITNLTNANLDIDIKGRLLNHEGGSVNADALRTYVVGFIRSKRYGWVPDPIFAAKSVHIAPYHTAGLWIQVDSRNLRPGSYTGQITLNHASGKPRRIRLDVTVLPVKLPEETPIYVQAWMRTIEGQSADPGNVRWLRDHGINVVGQSRKGPDKNLKQQGQLRLLLDGINPPYTAENVAKTVQKWKDRGLSYEDWAVYLGDEPDDAGWHWRVEKARAIRQCDPNIRFYANPGWQAHTSMVTLKGLAPYVDYWAPYVGHLRHADRLSFLKSTGKPVWFYKCDGFLSKNPAMCFNYFRKFGWVTFYYDIDGCGFWALSGGHGDPWNDLDAQGVDGDGADPVIAYPGRDGFVSTRNSEGFREGIEDYKYLTLLLKHGVPSATLRKLADQMLHSSTIDQVREIRRSLLAMLVEKAR